MQESDPELCELLELEEHRQKTGIELIPSENYASRAVMEAVGSVLMDKYSEGYPGKRYYGGNKHIDAIEELAIRRAKELFRTDYHANVQPYSGSPANIAVYVALLEFGDKVLGMSLAHGGHLTHGHRVNFSGRAYEFAQYGVRQDTEVLDYDEIEGIALRERPKLIVCGATCYPRVIDFARLGEIAKAVGAHLMADISHIAGLIAAELHPSPFGAADVITTTTHKTLRGPRGAIIFCRQEFAERIDRAVFPGLQGGPHDHVNAGKAVALGEALKPEFREYSAQVIRNAQTLTSALQARGLRIVSGGTDNHLLLVDLRPRGLSGKEAEQTLDEVGITVNKNMIPYDPATPFNPSGIRMGTPAVTTRGMREPDMERIAAWVDESLRSHEDTAALSRVGEEVRAFADQFPVPGLS